MQLLHHRRIARKPARIKLLHFFGKFLDFLESLGVVLGQMMKLIQGRYYVPNNSAVLITGDVDPENAFKVASDAGEFESANTQRECTVA